MGLLLKLKYFVFLADDLTVMQLLISCSLNFYHFFPCLSLTSLSDLLVISIKRSAAFAGGLKTK